MKKPDTRKKQTGLTYAASGVDINEGARLVSLIKRGVRSTYRKEVMGDIGGFGALFSAGFKTLKYPVLVSSTDGVGTKLKIAFLMDRHDTIGIDLVAMSVNDILVSGAEPLFFLDYFACGKLNAKKAASVVKGIAAGCKLSGCALIGGETAEMPGIYSPDEYDLAGFAVGVVDRKKIITGKKIKRGDSIIGLASSGLHSNGYSLARKVIFESLGLNVKSVLKELGGKTAGEMLLTPTRIYVKPVLKLMKDYEIKGMAHITGGGFTENIPRILPSGVKAVISRGSWPVPDIFKLIHLGGSIEETEMLRTFNCGIGMIMAVSKRDESAVLKTLKTLGEKAFAIGEITRAERNDNRTVEFSGDSDIF
ncbi:MAG: phosphoribosylformylglycinamidine cyclo-ligase [Deltaproteobacteria bacterium]|nr:phosphoribosylformylglycinamidine cyclo-ligase [Deltaproteobacteria bacterium]